ncbi:hypothetical protein DSLASN_13230 [Desulfoluna limicola]|uniref:Outer membrane protein beta-barrel domain-containing protein n=1 Tax=Desulfoluna limicola TaxID=2810562 RepID=A0ABM7PDT5_9BACT|nr:hypothetical protein [Desulfoluna limicola]BCS95691.1 hypothetical protein DSLASN_13230 [Desulfoluna limicola]
MTAFRFTCRPTGSIRVPALVFLLCLMAIPRVHADSGSPWTLSAGVSLGYLETTAHAEAGTREATLDVDTLVSPFLKLGYGLTPSVLVEVKAGLDIYSGALTGQTGTGSSSLRGFSVEAGPTWVGSERSSTLVGSWRPLLHAGLRYGILRGDLDYPVENFEDAWGMDIAGGVAMDNWEIRLTGTWITHENGHETPGVDTAKSSGELGLSRIGLECAWHFYSVR